MRKKASQLLYLLKENTGLFLTISFGVFLFVLFFQPFPIEKFDFNNRLIFISGLAGIVFILMVMVRITFSWLFQEDNQNKRPILPPFLSGLVLTALSSVAFAFYLRYVGSVSISFYIMFKVVLICLASPVTLRLYDIIKELKEQNEILIKEKKLTQKQIERYEEDYLNKSIEFVSDNNADNLKLLIADVAFIRSADNYVEIVYKEAEVFKKKLIRSTMKNIEHQIKGYSNFIRCHRICIVNTHFVEKLYRNYNNYWIIIKGYEEQIPVSRQYLLKLKEIF
jgi:hypothetical protein